VAETVAGNEEIITAINAMILAKLSGADIQEYKIGDESTKKMSIKELQGLIDWYTARNEKLEAGTIYRDNYDDGIQKTGVDRTVYIGDTEE